MTLAYYINEQEMISFRLRMDRSNESVDCDDAYLVDFAESSTAEDLDKVELVELATCMLPLLDQVSGGCTPSRITSHEVTAHYSARLHGESTTLILLIEVRLAVLQLDKSVGVSQCPVLGLLGFLSLLCF